MNSNVILGLPDLREVVGEFRRHGAFLFDVESMGENRGVPHLNSLTWMSLATDGLCVAIPFGHPIGTQVIGTRKEPRLCADGKTRNYTVPIYEDAPQQLTADAVFDTIKPLFFSEEISAVAHGASFDVASTAKYWGEVMPRPYECNIVLDWILDENKFAYGLKPRVKSHYGVDYDQENVGRCVEKHPFGTVAHYAYMDAKYGWLQYKRNRPRIEAEELQDVYALELDILEIVVDMRLRGTRVDLDLLRDLREEFAADLEETTGRLFKAAGRSFNINSAPQKQQLIFGPKAEGGQALKGWKLTEGARKRAGSSRTRGADLRAADFSTDDEALEGFAGNPVVDALREYQDISKLLGTYVDSWLGVDPDPAIAGDKGKPAQIYDGRIHADFVQYATKTGRFGCRNPNLQNIPTRTKQGRKLRYVFVADTGYCLVVADYSQIEPRVTAHYIGRGMLYDGFWAGIDPYIVNASAALRKDAKDVTPDERQVYGKTLMLAMGYGAGHKKVASTIGCTPSRAKEIIRHHEDMMPEVPAFKDAVIRKASSRRPVPYIRTLLGRKRRLPELNYSDNGLRMYAERQCFNSLIQGSAADLMKLAMVRVHAGLREIPDASINLTVHDELVLCGPVEYADQMSQILSDGMTGPGIQKLIKVPLKADVHVADRWGDAK